MWESLGKIMKRFFQNFICLKWPWIIARVRDEYKIIFSRLGRAEQKPFHTATTFFNVVPSTEETTFYDHLLWGAYSQTYSLAPRQPEKHPCRQPSDVPRQSLTSVLLALQCMDYIIHRRASHTPEWSFIEAPMFRHPFRWICTVIRSPFYGLYFFLYNAHTVDNWVQPYFWIFWHHLAWTMKYPCDHYPLAILLILFQPGRGTDAC